MCLYDKKRFRFTFKRIPIQKVVLEVKRDNIISYYSPYRHAPLSKKLGIYLLTIWWELVAVDIKYLNFRFFFSSEFWKIIRFNIEINLELLRHHILPIQLEDCYEFEGGFFHAFKANTNSSIVLKRFKYFPPQNIDDIDGVKIAKAILVDGYIPAFTRYALGEDGDICARRMVLDI